MEKARERIKSGYSKIKDDENKKGWPIVCRRHGQMTGPKEKRVKPKGLGVGVFPCVEISQCGT